MCDRNQVGLVVVLSGDRLQLPRVQSPDHFNGEGLTRDALIGAAQDDPVGEEVGGLICTDPLPFRALHRSKGEVGVKLTRHTLPAANGMPRLPMLDVVGPDGLRLVAARFSDAGGSLQGSIRSVNHSNAVATVAALEKELKGGNLMGLQRWDQPGSCSVVEGEATHAAACGMGKSIGQAVILEGVAPRFLNRCLLYTSPSPRD